MACFAGVCGDKARLYSKTHGFSRNNSKNRIYYNTRANEIKRDIIRIGHAVEAAVSDIVRFIPEKYSEFRKTWMEDAYSHILKYGSLTEKQEEILTAFRERGIPTVVVKGTSAAKYYAKPRLRTMGDIDLLVKPEDYERAVRCLTEIGCRETTSDAQAKAGRHRCFKYQNRLVELHRHFSSVHLNKVPSPKNPIRLFGYIQSHGEEHWKLLKKHPCLRSFAWSYELGVLIKTAVREKVGVGKLKSIYDEGAKRKELFSALKIK
ncbi:MAG: nucleotidyltransferase family protein [Eubacteriales bacterium]|nr:nucleotidyltransferase family protein [Eubacteriales bacterium]